MTRLIVHLMKNRSSKMCMSNKRNTLGMSAPVYKQLLAKLDEIGSKPAEAPAERIYTRLEYLDPYLQITLETADRSRREITVAARNISRKGMSVLHASFVYTDTRITAELHRVDGSIAKVSGTVCRCSHRGGVVHEIGIEFDREIIVQEFVRPDINESISSLEIVDPEQLKAKVIFVGNDEALMPFLREYLINTNMNFGFVNTAKDALEKEIDQYELVFACLDVGDMSGPEFAKHLREIGYHKPIILAGRVDDELTRQQIRLSNADMFLPVPITEKSLMCALGEFLLSQWSEKTLKMVRAEIDTETVQSLLTELTKLGILLDQQVHAGDPIKAYATCTRIRSLAPLLGMKNLRDLALEVGEGLADSGELHAFDQQISAIVDLCKGAKQAA